GGGEVGWDRPGGRGRGRGNTANGGPSPEGHERLRVVVGIRGRTDQAPPGPGGRRRHLGHHGAGGSRRPPRADGRARVAWPFLSRFSLRARTAEAGSPVRWP